MKLAVIGCRHFDNYDLLLHSIDRYYKDAPIKSVISGGASGADSLAAEWVKEYNLKYRPKIELVEFLPDWDLYGKRAGFIRNELIISAADEVLAFWDGLSRGTANSLSHAKKQKKNTVVVYF